MSVQAFPKPIRLKDKDYVAWVRSRPCLVDYVVAHAHHTISIGAGGSDYRTVPLCHMHHRELHRVGRSTFETRHRLDLTEEVLRLMEMYISARGEG